MADPKRLKRAARRTGLVGCCAVGVSLLLAAQAFAVVTVTVETSDGVPGGNLTLTMSLSRDVTDPVVANADTDIIFDTAQIQLIGSCSNGGSACQSSAECGQGTCVLPCQLDLRLTQQSFTANSPSFPPVPAGHRRVRLAVFDDVNHPTASFDTGVLLTCIFQVPASALPNRPVSLMAERLEVGGPCVLTPAGMCGDNSFSPIPDAQIHVTPGTILPPPPTATPTRTPTPPIPCFVDKDCPLGQVCDAVNKVCKPAPTPTPTIACPDGNCPAGLTCVDGVCKDLSTPTPTPTALPTCTTDAECVQLEGPGFQCRAGVCVPIRECSDTDPVLDRTNCRGERETCTNGTCECGGDCNLDGFVLGNEITRMTCILGGQCEFSDCMAGDFNGDGEIKGTEICQAVTNLGLGCPAEGQPLIFGEDLTGQTRSLDIGSAVGTPGTNVTITVNLSGEGELRVATAQMDLLFDTGVLEIPDPATACTVAQRLTTTNASFTFLPQTPGAPPGHARLRLFVGDLDLCKDGLTFPVGSFDQGPLISCTFRINPLAPLGDSSLTAARLNVGDPRGDEFTAMSMSGKVTVQPPPSCATNAECPSGTHCRAGVCKGIRMCSGPTSGPSECLNGREACIEQACECAADCDLDGRVRNDEVTTLVNIFIGHADVSECPEADVNGDDRLRNNEVTVGAINFTEGCQ